MIRLEDDWVEQAYQFPLDSTDTADEVLTIDGGCIHFLQDGSQIQLTVNVDTGSMECFGGPIWHLATKKGLYDPEQMAEELIRLDLGEGPIKWFDLDFGRHMVIRMKATEFERVKHNIRTLRI